MKKSKKEEKNCIFMGANPVCTFHRENICVALSVHRFYCLTAHPHSKIKEEYRKELHETLDEMIDNPSRFCDEHELQEEQ